MIRLKSVVHSDSALITCLPVCFEERGDAAVSALLRKSVQHVHRYAAFLQTVEYGFLLSAKYVDGFERFPADRKVDVTCARNRSGLWADSTDETTDG